MTHREKLIDVYKKKNRGKIPWAVYHGFLLPAGSTERDLRNNGCGMIKWAPVHTWQPPGMSHMNGWMLESEIKNVDLSVTIAWAGDERIIRRRYETPVGSVEEQLREDPGYHSLWVKEFMVKSKKDYDVIKYMVEHTRFRETYSSFVEARDSLGEDGVELAVIDRSPFQKLLIEICGTERLAYDLIDIQGTVEELYQLMADKQNDAFKIIAASPAEIIWMVDNLTGDITTPKYFEKYCLPFYNRQAKVLHENDKYLAVHFDGRLKNIKHLIQQADLDVVESFTLPEMGGDLPLAEASKAWKDKSIIANIPAFLCYQPEDEVREYLHDLLETIAPRTNFMLELSENIPLQFIHTLLPIVGDVFEHQ
jgi:hypothetical protein